jgi:hypothetical protein
MNSGVGNIMKNHAQSLLIISKEIQTSVKIVVKDRLFVIGH